MVARRRRRRGEGLQWFCGLKTLPPEVGNQLVSCQTKPSPHTLYHTHSLYLPIDAALLSTPHILPYHHHVSTLVTPLPVSPPNLC